VNYYFETGGITVSNEQPSNGSTGISLTPWLNITVGHMDDDNGVDMNVTFRTNATGSWGDIGTNSSVNNGTYRWTNSSMDSYNTKYWWSVNVSDGHGTWSNHTYSFTTESLPPAYYTYTETFEDDSISQLPSEYWYDESWQSQTDGTIEVNNYHNAIYGKSLYFLKGSGGSTANNINWNLTKSTKVSYIRFNVYINDTGLGDWAFRIRNRTGSYQSIVDIGISGVQNKWYIADDTGVNYVSTPAYAVGDHYVNITFNWSTSKCNVDINGTDTGWWSFDNPSVQVGRIAMGGSGGYPQDFYVDNVTLVSTDNNLDKTIVWFPSDAHIGYSGDNINWLNDAVSDSNKIEVDYAFHDGDMITETAGDDSARWTAFNDAFNKTLISHGGNATYASYTTGNHDEEWNGNSWLTYNASHSGYPDPWTYQFENVLVIGLHDEVQADAAGQYGDQLNWFNQTVQANSDKIIIVIMHHPINDTTYLGSYQCGNLDNDNYTNLIQWMNQSEDYHIDIWISAHIHMAQGYDEQTGNHGLMCVKKWGVIFNSVTSICHHFGDDEFHPTESVYYNFTRGSKEVVITAYDHDTNTWLSSGNEEYPETFNLTYPFGNTIPVQSGESPTNGSTNITTMPSLHVICTDADSDTMTATWRSNSSGAWVTFATNSSISSGTNITQTNSNFSAYSTTYYWSVNLTDGTDWCNETYHFTTEANNAPTQSSESPTNQSTDVSVSRTNLSIYLSDPDGDSLNWTIETSPDIGSASYNTVFGNVTSYQEDSTNYSVGIYTNTVDGDWSTFNQIWDDTLYFNYTKPVGAINATWHVAACSVGGGTHFHRNYTIPDSGLNYYSDRIWLKIVGNSGAGYYQAFCYSGSWQPFSSEGDDYIVEEAINWQYNSSNGTKSCYISGLDYDTTYYWYVNVTDGTDWNNETYHFTTEIVSPTVTTNDSTGVEETNATLHGYLSDDGGESCSIWFEWGTTTSYGNTTENLPEEVGHNEYFDSGVRQDSGNSFSPFHNGTAWCDGDWGSYSLPWITGETCCMYFGYISPDNAVSAEWEVKDGFGQTKLSLSNDYFGYYGDYSWNGIDDSKKKYVELKVVCSTTGSDYVKWYAYNFTLDDYDLLRTNGGNGSVYEERMHWNYETFTSGNNKTAYYWFDSFDPSNPETYWTDWENLEDGNRNTWGTGKFIAMDGTWDNNTCDGTYLGPISDVVLRVTEFRYNYAAVSCNIKPKFGGSTYGTQYNHHPPISWIPPTNVSKYITESDNAPDPWTWNDVSVLDVEGTWDSGVSISMLEMLVEYRYNLTPGTLYHYRAVANNSAGTSYGSDQAFLTKPNPATSLSITNITNGFNVSWTHAAVGNYNASVLVCKTTGYPTSPTDGTEAYNGTNNYYENTSLVPGTTYYYRVWEYAEWTYTPTFHQFSDGNESASETYDPPPEIGIPTVDNETVGYGYNVTVNVSVWDNDTGVSSVKCNVTYPDSTYYNFSMTNTGGQYYEKEINLTDTWQLGWHNYTIFATDGKNGNTSSQYSFNVSAQCNVTVQTLKDSYGDNEYVNITDPPDPPLDPDIEAYHYWSAPEHSFGISSTKTVNWSYFKQLFLAHTDWMLEYKRYEYSDTEDDKTIQQIGDEPFNNTDYLGWELLDNNKVLHIWNKHNSYYFNWSNCLQFSNYYNEYWTHNVLMLGYYSGDDWNLIYRTDELSNFNKNITGETDNYINATIWKDLQYTKGGNTYDFRLAIRYCLGVNDSDLTVIPYIKNLGIAIPYVLGFGWEMKDIQIDNNVENDQIRINSTSYLLNQTLDKKYTNITRTIYEYNETTNETTNYTIKNGEFYLENINDATGKPNKNLYLKWNPELDYLVWVKSRDDQYNAPVTLFIKVGILAVGQEKSTELHWYDSPDIVDSYSEENQDSSTSVTALHPSSTGANSAHGQSFTCDGAYKITSVKFYMKKAGSPTGNGHAVLYAHGGTYGTSSVPTGTALATSDDFDVSDLTTDFQLITFTFTGAQQYEMQESTYYCIVYENPTEGTIDTSNYVSLGIDASSPTHDGNSVYWDNSAWHSVSVFDDCFYVYGEAAAPENTAPTQSGEVPANTSTGISLQPTCNVTVNDADGGDTLTVTFYENTTGSWVLQQTNSSVSPGTSVQWDNYSNASAYSTKYWWSVNLTDGTDWCNETYHFTGYIQSKINNVGTTNSKGYLLMQVHYNDSGTWIVEDDTINETTTRTINSSEHLKLDSIFNDIVNTSVNLSHGPGSYRVYVAFRDPYGNVLQNDDSTYMNASYNFTYAENTSINVTPSQWNIGTIDIGDTDETTGFYFNLTNEGNVALDITINATHAKNTTSGAQWNLTTTPSYNNFSLKYNLSSGGSWIPINITFDTFVTGLAVDSWQTFDLKLLMATTSSTVDPMEVTVTFKSVAS